jgi:hypothetical protein
MTNRSLETLLLLACVYGVALADEAPIPSVTKFDDQSTTVSENGRAAKLHVGESIGGWCLMEVVRDGGGKPRAVLEDFSSQRGKMMLVDEQGHREELKKSLEATFVDPKTLYRGHSFQEVVQSDHDLLGAEILSEAGDPNFAEVAACFVPITKMETYAFVGTQTNADKVGVFYGGRTANFDPAVLVPEIGKIREEGRVLDGLVGGYLPVLRFVYPESDSSWTELILFAPERMVDENAQVQPVWYRVSRVEGNRLKWAKYFDSYLAVAPRREPPGGEGFYQDLVELRAAWENRLAAGMQMELPDERLANQAKHSLIRAMITRIGGYPKYGVTDRNYGGSEHDGFQDTLNVDATAMLVCGEAKLARNYLDNYFDRFVRDDGSILYRGPETGQYGRMLTVIGEYYVYTGDAELLLKHRRRIDAIARLLLAARRRAEKLPHDDAAYGMISGWCEADSCLEPEPARYDVPYLSNSSEAVSGFAELGRAWEQIGRNRGDTEMTTWGASLANESRKLAVDLQAGIARSMLPTQPPSLPVVAGAKVPFDAAIARDVHDPQFRAYRANMELLYSGCLTEDEVKTIVMYRAARRDVLLGVPAAYRYQSGEMAGFLSYGHAYGLLQYDMVREFLLELYSLSAHQYTRGTWTAPETRRLDPAAPTAPYCVPAQLSVPLLVRWMLAFEDPRSETLWLCKATPREWLEDGKVVAASGIPTRWGMVGFSIRSQIDRGQIEAEVMFADRSLPHVTKLRLRAPSGRALSEVQLNGKPWDKFDAKEETITLPESTAGKVNLVAKFE